MTSMNPLSRFFLTTQINLDNTAKITSSPLDLMTKYTTKNNLCLQLGIKNYNLMKDKFRHKYMVVFLKNLNYGEIIN